MSTLKTSFQLSLLSVSVLSSFAPPATVFANSVNHAPNKSTKKVTAPASLASLIKSDNIWAILQNAAVKQSMKNVMGNEYPLFAERTQQLESIQLNGDETFSQGGVEGLYTIQESAIDFNTKTNRAQVAILDNDNLNIWGASNSAELTKPMKDYVANLKSRKSDVTTKVMFQPPNKSTIAYVSDTKSKANTKTGSKKNISVASPSGTYSRESQWDGGTLQIVKLKGNKIKLGLSAAHGANTGGASGIVDLVNNKATYKGEGFKLGFEYGGKSMFVTESGEGFGGMNVHADGTYKKVDDKVPAIDERAF
jgi:hypothetical protein